MHVMLSIAVMISLVVGCASSSDREETVETQPLPVSRDIGTVPVPNDIRQVMEQHLIMQDPQRIPSHYRLYGDFTNYAFTVSTTDPATAALDFLTREGKFGDLSWQWGLTTTIPPEPRADIGPHAPPGFKAPLPGGPYAASTTTGPAGNTSYALYVSPNVIIVAGHSDHLAKPAGEQGIQHLEDGRTRIDYQDTSIAVTNGETDSSFVAVSGPEAYRQQIIDLIDWDHLAFQYRPIS